MKKSIIFSSIKVTSMLTIFCISFVNQNVGVSKNRVEMDARSSQRIDNDWLVSEDSSGTMSVMLFYNEDLTDHTYSIYVNYPGLSFGYMFKGGGSSSAIQTRIEDIDVRGAKQRVLITMNKQRVNKMEYDDGDNIIIIDIDSQAPFVYILPNNTKRLMFYDIDGKVIETIKSIN